MEQLEKAKGAALKYVTIRMRTRQEVKEQLQKKGYEDEIVAQVIAFLQEYRYLDDTVYCRSWILDRIQFHPCGRQKMSFDLAKKISDRQLIRDSLEEYFPAELERELAMAAAQKKLSGSGAVSQEKLARFLYSRGYSGPVINHVLQADSIINALHQRQKDNNNNF